MAHLPRRGYTHLIQRPVRRNLRTMRTALRLALLAFVPGLAFAAEPAASQPVGTPAPGEFTLREDPTTYGEEQSLPAAWRSSGYFWETRHGGLRSADKNRTWCAPAAAPNGTTVTVEAQLTIAGGLGGGWKSSGVAVIAGLNDYWLLAMSEAPDNGKGQTKRLFELSEMLRGTWQANLNGATTLTTDGPQRGGTWAPGTPLRLRLELTPEHVRGTVSSAAGEIVWQGGFALPAATEAKKAVTWGVPTLWNNQFDTTFSAPRMEVHGAVAQPVFSTVTGDAPPLAASPAYDAPAMSAQTFPATGFFHLAEERGVSWLVDPTGHAYFSVGVEQVKFNGHFSPKLGYSPYNRNVTELYGNAEKWGIATAAKMHDTGFNTAGMMRGPGPVRLSGIAYTNLINVGAGFVGFSDLSPITINGFPNVFHPRWAEYCQAKAQEFCAPLKNDPWLLGYYIDNELDWHGSNVAAFFIHSFGGKPLEYGLILDTLNKPADHSAHRALLAFLAERHGTIAQLNQQWGTHFASFDAIDAAGVFTLGEPLVASQEDMRAFLHVIADRYFGTIAAAIRKADPNHLIIGTRFAGWSQDAVWEMCGKYCDAVSVNHYPFADLVAGTVDSAREMLNHVVTLCHKPIILSEWSFLSIDSGLPCQHGAGERFDTEQQRAEAFRIFQSMICEQPFVVGSDYFMWIDEPSGGLSSSSNPEDCSYGIVNEKDEPYKVVGAMAKQINSLAVRLHQQEVPRLTIDAAQRVVVVENLSLTARDVRVELFEDGVAREVTVHLADGKPATVALLPNAAAGTHRVMARPVVPGLLATDRQAAFISGVVRTAPLPAAGVLLAVSNHTARPIANHLVRIAIGDLFPADPATPCVALDGDKELPQQLELGDDGRGELLVLLDRLAPRSARFIRVEPRADKTFVASAPVALPFSCDNGRLALGKKSGSAAVLDSVALDGVQLGRLEALMWEKTPQNQFVPPNRFVSLTAKRGAVQTTLDCIVELDTGDRVAVVAEVDGNGKPKAAPPGSPGAYRAIYRIRLPAGVPYYTAQMRGVSNIGSSTWKLDRYYHYLPSQIGGDVAGDLPVNSPAVTEYYNPTMLWFDDTVGAGYGVLRPRSMFGSGLSIDPAGRQHGDLCRTVRLPLTPGQAWVADAEPEVPVFGCTGHVAGKPWEDVAADLEARAAVGVEVVR